MSSIHGHEVLHMMDGNNYTELSLLQAIEQKFGRNALFHTCTKKDMNAKQLIEFLKLNGKFKSANEMEFSVDSKKICRH